MAQHQRGKYLATWQNHNIQIFRNFITETECNLLTDWIINNYTTEVFKISEHPGTKRVCTRWSSNIKYPAISYEIQKRLDDKITEIFKYKKIKKVPNYLDGMYASYVFKGDKCKRHKDPIYLLDSVTYHCNLILTDHQGGQLILNDTEFIFLNKKDVIIYPVSEIYHETTELVDEKPRMFWNFGYCVMDQMLKY